MRRLIYTSRATIGIDASVLASILAASKAHNDRDGVTGMLWFGEDTFAQVLEGDAAAVGATMHRISHDPRHAHIRTIEDRDVVGRLFGSWAMMQADGGSKSIANTAYIVGLCARKDTGEARRLFDFMLDHG